MARDRSTQQPTILAPTAILDQGEIADKRGGAPNGR
jgi:hypothetical protein